mmetsp:Transcript_17134/g.27011  ORF Transcript_17134/g.27011 Transcript_17134/m.27011 type:complete len:210 (+) Transcript_17134:544-1173(+)
MDSVGPKIFTRLPHFPTACWKYVLVPFIPTALQHFSWVRLVLLDARVDGAQPQVVVHVEVEERPRLPARLRGDQVVEREVVRNDQVLFDVHQIVPADAPQFWEILGDVLVAEIQKLPNGGTFAYLDDPSMAGTVPVTVGHLQHLTLDAVLLGLPLALEQQLAPQLRLLPLAVRQEAGVHLRIFHFLFRNCRLFLRHIRTVLLLITVHIE